MASGGGNASPIPSELRDRLESLQDNCRIVVKQITGGASSWQHSDNFAKVSYWSNLASRFTTVSDWCTKLVVIFSKPPIPSLTECGPLVHGLETSILSLVSGYYGLPCSEGATLAKELREIVLNVVNEVEALSGTIIRFGCGSECEKLRRTGGVWGGCDQVSRMSKDNKAAVLRVLISNLNLLKDASSEAEELGDDGEHYMDELDQALGEENTAGGSDVGMELTDTDKLVVQSCIKLVKMCPTCVASVSRALAKHGSMVTMETVQEMDTAATVVVQISPRLDDLVSALYPPVNIHIVTSSAEELKKTMVHFLATCRNLTFCKAAPQLVDFDEMMKDISSIALLN